MENFWVRGIGLGTYRSRNDVDKFSVDCLWDMAKQCKADNIGSIKKGYFIPQFTIPYFSDYKYYKDMDYFNVPSHNTVCAVVGEDRLRILVEPLDSINGDALCWCRQNEVPLYCFCFGFLSKGRPLVSSYNIVINKSACVVNYVCGDVVGISFPSPYEEKFKICEITCIGDSAEEKKERALRFFHYSEDSRLRDGVVNFTILD